MSSFSFEIPYRKVATLGLALFMALALCASGCHRSEPAPEVVLYTSVDEPVARPIVEEFEKQSGIRVVLFTDTEAAKSVGLAERLRAEKSHPQADVFWSNEPFYTIGLASEGLLAPYESPAAKDIPPQYRSNQNLWASIGLRARVIASVPGATAPQSVEDFAKPEFKEKLAMARPTAGTTGGHVAALYVLWGDEKANRFFQALRRNDIKLLGGNSVVAEQVAMGNFVAGLTDNDDCYAASTEVKRVKMTLPDQDGAGALMLPSTIGLVAGAPHPDAGKKLIDYLLLPATERKLQDAHFVLTSVRNPTAGGTIKPMQIDYEKTAREMPHAIRTAISILEGRGE